MFDIMQAAAATGATNAHAGDLTATVIATISGVAVGFVKFVQAAFKPSPAWQAMTSMLFSAVALGVWAYSEYAYSREGLFNLLAAYALILAASYGIFQASTHDATQNIISQVTFGKLGTSSADQVSAAKRAELNKPSDQ